MLNWRPFQPPWGAITMIARNRNRVLPKGKWRHVSTWDDGRINTLRGHYTVADGLITVMSQHGTKTIHVEGLPPAVLAKIVLRKLAADRKADGTLLKC
jgi:hypothetical protein